MFLPQEIIRKKRDGQLLSRAGIAGFVRGIAEGNVTEGQIAAFAMAVYFNDMNIDERVALTLAQRDSGHVLQWQSFDLPGPVLDKHSTGGVGDLTSLLLGPMVAACGGFVPMISGRGRDLAAAQNAAREIQAAYSFAESSAPVPPSVYCLID